MKIEVSAGTITGAAAVFVIAWQAFNWVDERTDQIEDNSDEITEAADERATMRRLIITLGAESADERGRIEQYRAVCESDSGQWDSPECRAVANWDLKLLTSP